MRPRPLVCFVLSLLSLPALAAASVTVSPSSVTIRPSEATPLVTVQLGFSFQSIGGSGTLEITPPSALIGSLSLEPNPVTYSYPDLSDSASTQFRLVTTASAPPGNYTFIVADDTLDAGSTTFNLRILEPPLAAFSGRLTPSTVDLSLGRPAMPLTVETLPGTGFDKSVRWQVVGLPGFIHSGSSQTSSAPAFPDLIFGLELGHSATPGSYSGTVRGTAAGAPTINLPLTVVVSEPSFTPRVAPERVNLIAGGESGLVTVNTSAPGLQSGRIRYSLVGLPAGVIGGGQQVATGPAFAPVQFVLRASTQAVVGVSQALVRGVFQPGGVVREVPVTLTVETALPQITSVQPARVVAGSLGQRVAIVGRDFEPGARIESLSPGVLLSTTRFVSANRLEAEIDLRRDLPGGVVRLLVVNPDGARSPSPGILPVVAAGALGAPLSVQTVAVLHPAPGATVASGERVRPRGVLAVSGSGPLVVSWRLDGMPFDRFVVQARGGDPVAVEGRVPIPETTLGQHLLQLVVEGAREIASEPVAFVQVVRRESRLRMLSPRSGRVVQSSHPPLLTWTQVPGSTGYVVEVVSDHDRVMMRWPARRARWRPPGDDLARLAGGSYRWRVRPVFAGGVVGDALEPRSFALLPRTVALSTRVQHLAEDRLSVTWEGGALGALYRVECVDTAGEVVFSALTTRAEYQLPRGLAQPEGGWRVSAIAPDGSILGVSATANAPRATVDRVRRFRRAAESEVVLTVQSPSDSGEVATARPEVTAHWDNAVDVEDVFLMVDSTDVTLVATTSPQSIVYEPLLPLDPGVHRVFLAVGERIFEWSFTVAVDETESGEEIDFDNDWSDSGADWGGGIGGGDVPSGENVAWQVDLEVTGSWVDGDDLASAESEVYGTLSVSGEERGAHAYVQASADVSARQAIAPDNAFEEQNRSWVLDAGHQRGPTSQELTLGYTAPIFLSGGTLLTAGLPKGGVQAGVGAGPMTVSYYQAFDPDLEGVVTGLSGAEQDLRAAAVEFGEDGGSQLRLIGLEVEEKPDAFFGGGDGTLYGLYGAWHFSGGSSVTVELAHGEYTPSPASLETPGEGDAARLALSTLKGQWTLDLNLRYVEPEFINPTNRGLAAGGISDRQGVDLRLGRSWQRGRLDLGMRRDEGGIGSGATAVDSSLSSTDVSISQQVGANADLNLSGAYNLVESDADPGLGLAATEQADWNVALVLSERAGGWTWGQDFSLSQSDDRLDPTLFSDSAQAGLSLQRAGECFGLFLQLSGVRTRFGVARDTTESLLATLQPTWTWAGSGLSITPYGSYSRVEDSFSLEPTVSESYRFTMSWSPPLFAWLSALQVSSEWARTQGAFALSNDFVATYSASLALGWGTGRSGQRSKSRVPDPVPGVLLPADSVVDI